MVIKMEKIIATLVDMWLANPKMTNEILYVRWPEDYSGCIETYSYDYGFHEIPEVKPLKGFLPHPFNIRHQKDSEEYGIPKTILLARVPVLFSIVDRGDELLSAEERRLAPEEITVEDLYRILGIEETKKRLAKLFLNSECDSLGNVFIFEEIEEEELVKEWGGLTAYEIAQACAAEWLNTYREVFVSIRDMKFEVSSEPPVNDTDVIHLWYDNGDIDFKQPNQFWRLWLDQIPEDRFVPWLNPIEPEKNENEIRKEVGEDEFRRRAELMFLTMLQKTQRFPYGIYDRKKEEE